MGETPIRPIAESRSWRSQAYWIGVLPDGDQVRRQTGCSMKPLSSKKTMGLRPFLAPFLFAASRGCANGQWPLRFVLVPAARAFGTSSRVREEFSTRVTGDTSRRTFAELLRQLVGRSKDRCDSRPCVGLLARSLSVVASVSGSDAACGRNAVWPLRPPVLLSVRPDANALPMTRKPRRSPQLFGPIGQPAITSLPGAGKPPVPSSFLSFS